MAMVPTPLPRSPNRADGIAAKAANLPVIAAFVKGILCRLSSVAAGRLGCLPEPGMKHPRQSGVRLGCVPEGKRKTRHSDALNTFNIYRYAVFVKRMQRNRP